jgi:hypothetical protein
MTHAAFSNEAQIQRGLDLLGCATSNFCRLVGCGKTRFQAVLNGVGHFSDDEAERFLSYLKRLFELQSAIDAATRDADGKTVRVPMDFTRYEEIGSALTIRLAQEVCLESDDHALDGAAASAVALCKGHAASTAGESH